jgi:pimeloyl-ACP methyl ester carboxylesterase
VPDFEPIVARYLHLPVDGEDLRLYFEEAGQGHPLVCLYTAGADTCQYRHILADERILKRWRVIAFDMPYHGKSNPPGRSNQFLDHPHVHGGEMAATYSSGLGAPQSPVEGKRENWW